MPACARQESPNNDRDPPPRRDPRRSWATRGLWVRMRRLAQRADNADVRDRLRLPRSGRSDSGCPLHVDSSRPFLRGAALTASLGASGAGFAASGAAGMAMGALSPAVGYLAKKAADRMTTGAMDRLGDLGAVGGNASALQAPLNAVQRAARSATAPLSAAITNAGILASLGRSEPDSRAAALSELLSKYNPPEDDGLGATFAQ
jgi:hypothetical protein